MHHRFIVMCLIGFSGFLRINELTEIHVGDLNFDESCLKIVIPKSKNNQVPEGHIVFIHRSNTPYCPVSQLEHYISKTGLKNISTNFVMCRLAKTRIGHNAIGHRSISDVTIRDEFKKFISPFCTVGQNFRSHKQRHL